MSHQDPSYFEMFRETFNTVARDSLHTRFKYSFYVTKASVYHVCSAQSS